MEDIWKLCRTENNLMGTEDSEMPCVLVMGPKAEATGKVEQPALKPATALAAGRQGQTVQKLAPVLHHEPCSFLGQHPLT